jgi:hypothetical protein
MFEGTRICNICKTEYEYKTYDDGSYSGAYVDGMPVCYPCWGIEYGNRKPIIISYSRNRYIEGKEDDLIEKVVLLKDLPPMIDSLIREAGMSTNWILIRCSCGDPDLNKHKEV